MLVILCEYAASAPDGSVNVVRGGLDKFETDGFPLQLQAFALILVSRHELAAGDHTVKVTVRNSEGQEVILGEGSVGIVDGALPTRLALPVNVRVLTPGRKIIEVQIGDKVATESFEVQQRFPVQAEADRPPTEVP